VIITAAAVWAFESGWPDLIGATVLLILFFGSAARVLGAAWRGLGAHQITSASNSP
jgi:hypothetical protein